MNLELLNELMTRPTSALKNFITSLDEPLIVLGAGGKMGPSLCVLAKRAAQEMNHPLRVIAVSRFSDHSQKQWLEANGVETTSADLMDENALKQLPDSSNILYLVGFKFGTSSNPAFTWAVNTLVPANVCKRYPKAHIVALSTGNVYPFVPIDSGGATEDTPLSPVGEYANACLARERIFQHFSQAQNIPVALIRLNYATDLRYGVLVDIAQKVKHGSIDVQNGYFNCIWQRDANDMIIRALSCCEAPAKAWNLTGLDTLSVREIASSFASMLQTEVEIVGEEAPTALLSNALALTDVLGEPETPLVFQLAWTAEWIQNKMPLLGKPTHFEVRDGKF